MADDVVDPQPIRAVAGRSASGVSAVRRRRRGHRALALGRHPHQIYLGTAQWLKTTRAWVEGEERSNEIPKTQRFIARPSVDRVLETVAEVMEVSVADIVEDRGGLPRMLAAYIAVREGLLRLRDVAASLTLRSSGHISDLVRRCAKAIGQQRDVAAKAEACLARLRPVILAVS